MHTSPPGESRNSLLVQAGDYAAFNFQPPLLRHPSQFPYLHITRSSNPNLESNFSQRDGGTFGGISAQAIGQNPLLTDVSAGDVSYTPSAISYFK